MKMNTICIKSSRKSKSVPGIWEFSYLFKLNFPTCWILCMPCNVLNEINCVLVWSDESYGNILWLYYGRWSLSFKQIVCTETWNKFRKFMTFTPELSRMCHFSWGNSKLCFAIHWLSVINTLVVSPLTREVMKAALIPIFNSIFVVSTSSMQGSVEFMWHSNHAFAVFTCSSHRRIQGAFMQSQVSSL